MPPFHPIFTAGYGTSKHAPGDMARSGPRATRELVLAARALDAMVLDIRHAPQSRLPGWDKAGLCDALGKRYRHLPHLGNLNYSKDGPIQLANARDGIPLVLKMASFRPVILLCGCASYSGCHRAEVAHLLDEAQREAGVEVPRVEELAWPCVPLLDLSLYPDLALSIKQPWAWLICEGLKDVENRSWAWRPVGRFLIHASKSFDIPAYEELRHDPRVKNLLPRRCDFDRGGIVGEATMTGCVQNSESPWFQGEYGFVVERGAHLPFLPLAGALGFFQPSMRPAPNSPRPNSPRIESEPYSASTSPAQDAKACDLSLF